MTSAPRHRLAVEALALAGEERVLEIGCGAGVATRLVLERLTTGSITALDRSASMIEIVRKSIANPRLRTRAEALEEADWAGERFDAILAVNVDFNLRLGERWPAMLGDLLAPGGRIVLAFEAPEGSGKGDAFARLARERLEKAGFATGVEGMEVVVIRASRR